MISTLTRTNKRSSLRKPARRTVKVHCRKGTLGLGPNVAVAFLDVSEGGVRLLVKAPLEPGDEVEVALHGYGLPEAIVRVAHVTWALPVDDGQHAVGLRFQKRIPFRAVQTLATP
jgi:hypothetical protein